MFISKKKEGKKEFRQYNDCCTSEYAKDLNWYIDDKPGTYQILVEIDWNKKITENLGKLPFSHIISCYGPTEV